MRKFVIIATLATLGATIVPAAADNAERACRQSRETKAIAADDMKAQIDKLGYDVRRLKSDDGCFRTTIVDRASGGAVRAIFSAATGELVRASLASRE